MSEPIAAPTPAPTGNEFNTVTWAEPAQPEPTAPEPAAPEPAPVDPDFNVVTLENGTKEVRLSTGEVYKGANDAEIIQNIAKGKVEASRHIQTLRQQQSQPQVIPPQTPESTDQAAQALLDLMAPALGAKTGAELKEQLANQAQAMQELRNQQTAAQFYSEIPDGPRNKANTDKLGEFLDERKMPFTLENARLAHYYLKGTGQYVAETPVPRQDNGQFAPRGNAMPAPPSGVSATPAGVPDIWAMSPDEFQAYRAKMGATQ